MPSKFMHTNIKHIKPGILLVLSGVMFLLFILNTPAEAKSKSGYLYNLSSFTGTVPSLWSRLTVDRDNGELFSLNRQISLIQIYNQSSMLIHSYGEEYQLASALDISAGNEGDLFLIHGTTNNQKLMHLDYKGAKLENINLKEIPDSFLPFHPTRMEFRNEKLYLLDVSSLKLVVLTEKGEFLKGYSIRDLLQKVLGGDEEELKKLKIMDFNGFCVDARGSMYFTAPSSFIAFKMDPDETIRGFGSSGSGPGKFGVVSGIDVDSKGNIYVSDRLRSVVIVFDKDFRFVREFGYRGPNAENLIAPDDVVIDEQNGKLYVAQAANRGVSVFRLAGK